MENVTTPSLISEVCFTLRRIRAAIKQAKAESSTAYPGWSILNEPMESENEY
jgi:hypothetical protein